MHRRTRVLLTTPAQSLSSRLLRGQFIVPAITLRQACRYRIGLAEKTAHMSLSGGTKTSAVANAPKIRSCERRIVAKQFGRFEHQVLSLRMQERGINPDVVRTESEAPSQRRSGGADLELAGACFLRHFSLVQPYF